MRGMPTSRPALIVCGASLLAFACGESTSPLEQIPASITLVPSEITLTSLGDTETLTATVRDAVGNILDTTVTFESSDENVATIDPNGVVTAIGIGEARATATLGSLLRSSDVMVSQVGTEITKVSGDEQSAVVETALAQPVVVKVADALGNGIAGLLVDFTVVEGGGTVTVDSATTGNDGTASTEWTLGGTAGAVHKLVAAVGGVGRAEFSAVGLADVPVAAAVTAGNGQLEPVGATLPVALAVTVTDRLGNGVPGQDVSFAVTSGGGSVTPASAPTDENGEVRAQWTLGSTLGAQTLEAAVPGVIQTPLAFFAEGTNLAVIGISPDTLVEGLVARVTGIGFDTTVADIAVAVDGALSQITAATDTTIDFVVPQTPCRPARDVDVVVTTARGGTAPAHSRALAPRAFVALTVGEQVIVQSPSDFCFQFDAQATEETYLLGVQAAATSGEGLTTATVRGAVINAATASPSTWAALQAAPVASRPYQLDRDRADRWRLHREAETMMRAAQQQAIAAAGRSAPALTGAPAAIPRNVQVGDSVSLKLPDFNANICTDFLTVAGRVDAVGPQSIWVSDVGNPSGGFSTREFDSLSTMFDEVIFGADTTYFGAPTDLDDNGRVIILITRQINDLNQFVLGFVSPTDVLTTAQCESSNRAELYYSKAPDPTGVTGTVYPVEAALDDAPPLIAHEFAHIIQAGRRLVVNGNQFMASYMAEGQATLAEEVAGHAALGNTAGQNYGPTIALNTDDQASSEWYAQPFDDMARYFGRNRANPNVSIDGAPHECSWITREMFPCEGTSRPLWYGVTWSLLRWVSDHFGPSYPGGAAGIQRALVNNDRVGLANIENVLGSPIDSLLAQWSAMLYLDDRVSGLSERLTFPSWSLSSIFGQGGLGRLTPSVQLEPKQITFSEFVQRVEVRAASTAYFLLGGADRPATAVRVTDGLDDVLPSTMQVYLVRVK